MTISVLFQQTPPVAGIPVDKEIVLLIIGASIALISSVVTAVLQHSLNLKADKIRRARDKADDEIRRQRERAEKYREWKARGYWGELIGPEQMQRLNEQTIKETIQAMP